MRFAARVILLLMVAAGAVLAIVLPKTVEDAPGHEIGRWPAFLRESGFSAVEAALSSPDTPAVVTLELRSHAPLRAGAEQREVLELAVLDEAGDEILRSAPVFPGVGGLESRQPDVYLYRTAAGTLETEGRHRFVIGPGADFEDPIFSIHLVLNADAYRLDPRLQPAGFLLIVIGVVGFGLTLFRRRQPRPPAPRWGRL